MNESVIKEGLKNYYVSYQRTEENKKNSVLYIVKNRVNENYFVKVIDCIYHKNEIKLLKKDLPIFCIKLLDSFTFSNYQYLVFDHFPTTLYTYLENVGSLPLQTIKKWSKQICYALNELHKEGIYHMDIKPSNILLTKNSEFANCIICDFGSSTSENEEDSRYGDFTKGYKAPEVDGTKRIHKKADIFSFGVVIKNMTGFKIDQDETIWMTNLKNLEDPEWKTLYSFITQCLALDPSERPSAEDLLNHDLLRDVVLTIPSSPDKTHQFQIVQKIEFQKFCIKVSRSFYFFYNTDDLHFLRVFSPEIELKIVKSCCVKYVLRVLKMMENECISRLPEGHELISQIQDKITQFEHNDGDIIEIGDDEKIEFKEISKRYEDRVDLTGKLHDLIRSLLSKTIKSFQS